MRLGRLFEIVYILLDGKKITASILAEHFEVSTRTILRDIETLSMAGVPVITDKGKGGGISIMKHYQLDKTTLTKEEKQLIIFALQNIVASGNTEAKGVLSRLSSLFSEPLPNWVEVDFSRWGQSKHDNNLFDILRQAILQRKQIAFRYASSSGKLSNRKATPLKLIFKGRAWYTVCVEKPDKQKLFRLSRMLGVSILGDSKIGDVAVETIEGMTSSDSLIDVVFRFSPEVAYRVYDEFTEDGVKQDADGWLTVATRLPYDNWLIGFLLSFGTEVEVIKPIDLKRVLFAEARKIAEHYS